jgi:hypothetical protein
VAADDQQDVARFLSRPDTHGLSGGEVRRIDTHISIVWLAGDHALKLKRAVRFDYVDYSTVEKRRVACEDEVRLNRRTAPDLYRRVRAITKEPDGTLALDGRGRPVEWVVEMARFDEDTLFDRLAARQALDPSLMDGLASAIAGFHAQAEPRPDRGGVRGMAWVIDGNAQAFDAHGPGVLDREICRRVIAETRDALDRGRDLLEARRRHGLVRACHGDLHLRNIFLLNGAPTLFDAVEFNEEISCVDVLYDLAFLLMDLWYRGLRSHANRILNGYLALTADVSGLALMPLFLSCRAAIRSKTSLAASMVVPDEEQKAGLHTIARQYLALARALLHPPGACLVAIGGFSGSGKSTLARALAPDLGAAPGAVILRSDVIRKSLLGVDPLVRLGADAYTPEVSTRVYETLVERGRTALLAGHAVIADAVHARPEERAAIESVARSAGVPFVGIWLEGSEDVLAHRLRVRTGDPSDATTDVLARQMQSGARDLTWPRLDVTGDADDVRAKAEALLPKAADGQAEAL